MSEEKRSSEMPLEPERYELSAPPSYHFDFERREFLQVLGGGIVVLLTLEASAAQESGGRRRRFDELPQEIGAWLHIGEDGAVTVFTGKVEVGQNIRTSLTQAVADELRVPIDSVRLVMGDTDLTPFDFGTFGSRTTPTMAMQLRKASAAARELLIDQAAELWKVDRGSLVAADGSVSSEKTKRSATFGELTKGMKIVTTISEDAPTTPAERWAIAGRSIPKVEGSAFVTGAHRFTSDLKVPDMWYGKVLRLPSFGATLLTLDTSKAKAMTDVVVVHDGDFVGAAAPSEERAARAVEAMRAEWKPEEQPKGGTRVARPEPSCCGLDGTRSRSGGQKARGELYRGLYRACPSGAARRVGAMGGRQAHGLDRNPATLRSPGRARGGLPPFREPGPGSRPRYWLGLWR
jgi:isoquinoline 1-oxidoreductase